MDPRVRALYLREIIRQCDFAVIAFDAVQEALGDAHAAVTESEWPDWQRKSAAFRRLFGSLHAVLNHAAIVSKLLWPTKDGDSTRGEELRRVLAVDDSSPLKSRHRRNDLEHFDNFIDEWARANGDRGYLDDGVGPIADMPDSPHPLRIYDQKVPEFYVLGQPVGLVPLLDALRSVTSAAAANIASGT